MIKLPRIQFNLPRFEHHIQAWQKLNVALEETAKKAGKGQNFLLKMEEMKRLIEQKRWAQLDLELATSIGVRALFNIWDESLHHLQSSLTTARLQRIIAEHDGLTILALNLLMGVYFKYYDEINLNSEDASGLRLVQEIIESELLKRIEGRKRADFAKSESGFKKLYDSRYYLFAENAVMNITTKASKEKQKLEKIFYEVGISKIATSGRFHDACRGAYYLQQLKTIPLGEPNKILDEMLNENVYSVPYRDGQTLGFEAISILLDRTEENPSKEWTNWIVDIAGDPRLGIASQGYKRYWLALGEARVAKVLASLANLDLGLFLKAVEEYGNELNDTSLQRMFPARKRFLEGLLDLKLIRNARLMMGNTAEIRVKKILGAERFKDSHIRLGGDLSQHVIIYLDCGDFHIIEGSHSFRVWLYLKRPSANLMNFNFRGPLLRGSLITRVPTNYKKEYPDLPYAAFSHNGNGWILDSIKFLAEQGIHLDAGALTDNKSIIERFKYAPKPLRQNYNTNNIGVQSQQERGASMRSQFKEEPRQTVISQRPADIGIGKKELDLTAYGLKILHQISLSPNITSGDLAAELGVESLSMMLNGSLKKYCFSLIKKQENCWKLTRLGEETVQKALDEGKL